MQTGGLAATFEDGGNANPSQVSVVKDKSAGKGFSDSLSLNPNSLANAAMMPESESLIDQASNDTLVLAQTRNAFHDWHRENTGLFDLIVILILCCCM